jgi:hypothetical protein
MIIHMHEKTQAWVRDCARELRANSNRYHVCALPVCAVLSSSAPMLHLAMTGTGTGVHVRMPRSTLIPVTQQLGDGRFLPEAMLGKHGCPHMLFRDPDRSAGIRQPGGDRGHSTQIQGQRLRRHKQPSAPSGSGSGGGEIRRRRQRRDDTRQTMLRPGQDSCRAVCVRSADMRTDMCMRSHRRCRSRCCCSCCIVIEIRHLIMSQRGRLLRVADAALQMQRWIYKRARWAGPFHGGGSLGGGRYRRRRQTGCMHSWWWWRAFVAQVAAIQQRNRIERISNTFAGRQLVRFGCQRSHHTRRVDEWQQWNRLMHVTGFRDVEMPFGRSRVAVLECTSHECGIWWRQRSSALGGQHAHQLQHGGRRQTRLE